LKTNDLHDGSNDAKQICEEKCVRAKIGVVAEREMAVRLSICVPVFRGVPLLERTLDCLREEDLSGDCEIVFAIDGEDDGANALIRSRLDSAANFRILPGGKRYGLVGNWQRCVEAATGEWIKFLFQDDWLLPGAVARYLAFTDESSGFVVSRRHLAVEAGSDPQVVRACSEAASFPRVNEVVRWSAREYLEQQSRDWMKNILGEPSNVMFRRSLVATLGPFSHLFRQMPDHEYWIRLGGNRGLTFVPESLSVFRVHAGSETARNRADATCLARTVDPVIFYYLMAFDPRHEAARRLNREQGGRPFEKCMHDAIYRADLVDSSEMKEAMTTVRNELPKLRRPSTRLRQRAIRSYRWMKSFDLR